MKLNGFTYIDPLKGERNGKRVMEFRFEPSKWSAGDARKYRVISCDLTATRLMMTLEREQSYYSAKIYHFAGLAE